MSAQPHAELISATTASECKNEASGSCLPPAVQKKVARAGAAAPPGASESHKVRAALPEDEADAVLDAHFKVAGPRDTTELLTNEHIDTVLQQWAAADRQSTFVPFPFAMIDTTVKQAHHPLTAAAAPCSKTRFGGLCFAAQLAAGAQTFACVLNTDYLGRGGLHWFAVFVDTRPGRSNPTTGGGSDNAATWTVEYFNSSGRPAHPNVTRWMARARLALAEARAQDAAQYGTGAVESVRVSQIQHQRSQTECGLYALYYIRCRLDGTPYSRFARGAVSDSLMREFRQHVFRASA